IENVSHVGAIPISQPMQILPLVAVADNLAHAQILSNILLGFSWIAIRITPGRPCAVGRYDSQLVP
ncbi:MAG: hypothetical protein KDA51_11035, partial [Planctomycetales bacterium]|nr:hypothetical protein [Planctomycetales bacterium]